MLVCSKCGESKDQLAFSLDRSRPSGRHGHCKACQARRYRENRANLSDEERQRRRSVSRQWRADNPERAAEGVRNATLRSKYGISVTDYDSMLEAQDGKCKVCQECCPTGNRLAVDHDHITGAVRGLLCQPCNTSLGLMRDRPDLLRLAADYLEAT